MDAPVDEKAKRAQSPQLEVLRELEGWIFLRISKIHPDPSRLRKKIWVRVDSKGAL
jgi:hypothetical protein